MSNLKPAVFLDRDGVINQVVFRNGQPASPRSLAEFAWIEGIHSAVTQLKSANFSIFVVTNQPDIARNKLEPEVLSQISNTISQSLSVDDIAVCPHDNYHNCDCRKPRPGMLLSLASTWGIDLSQSFIIGDSWKDMAAGKSAGCQTILIEQPYNTGTEAKFQVADIFAATDLIFSLISQRGIFHGLRC
jgi:D-glycero-D-manno-heptose 1,7-bisphosphate phosphatase